ncbi:MAG: phosphoribosylformylglycinamidine synthase subunit PurL [Candidatus Odinarchaeia archaeon]
MPKVSGVNVNLTEEEIEKAKKMLKKEPNPVEIGMIDVMWSEHCSYKSSRPILKLLPTSGPNVIVGPGQDAGVVDIGDGYAVAFKIETHNHPSAIEPYNGAATGIGGIVRDILCMGARPTALLNNLRFGKLSSPHSQWLFRYVVKGIADYGNCIGVPTVGGDVEFDDSFERNCLVNVVCMGIMRHEDLIPSVAKNPGDILVLIGGSTGRDGIHGVTFASRVLTEESEKDRPAVQIGDPFIKKLIIEATLEAIKTGYVRGLKDLGGGGLTCASSEMAGAGGTGVKIYLDKVPLREKGMIPYEIMLSESQERMLFVVDPKGLDKVLDVFEKYEVPYSVVGEVDDSGYVNVYHKGELVAQVPAKVLSEPPTIERVAKKPDYIKELLNVSPPPEPRDLSEILINLIKTPNVASKAWVYRQYDHEVGIRTVVKPGHDAAVLRVLDTEKAVAIKSDGTPSHCYLDPYNGGAGAVAEACRNIVCVGAKPLAIVDCLSLGDPSKPEVFWQFTEIVKGMRDILLTLNMACVGGNVSFYNEDKVTGRAVKPCPIVVAVGVIDNFDWIKTSEFKNPGDKIILVGTTYRELGGSEYYLNIHNLEGGVPPKVRMKNEKQVMEGVMQAIRGEGVNAVHDCFRGGLAISIAEMCMQSGLGAEIDLQEAAIKPMRTDELLFSESHGRFILSVDKEKASDILEIFNKLDVPARVIGEVKDIDELVFKNKTRRISCSVSLLKKNWEEAIPRFMGMEKWKN